MVWSFRTTLRSGTYVEPFKPLEDWCWLRFAEVVVGGKPGISDSQWRQIMLCRRTCIQTVIRLPLVVSSVLRRIAEISSSWSHYRLGASYATNYLKISGQDGPKEYGVSAGFGIPIMNGYEQLPVFLISPHSGFVRTRRLSLQRTRSASISVWRSTSCCLLSGRWNKKTNIIRHWITLKS